MTGSPPDAGIVLRAAILEDRSDHVVGYFVPLLMELASAVRACRVHLLVLLSPQEAWHFDSVLTVDSGGKGWTLVDVTEEDPPGIRQIQRWRELGEVLDGQPPSILSREQFRVLAASLLERSIDRTVVSWLKAKARNGVTESDGPAVGVEVETRVEVVDLVVRGRNGEWKPRKRDEAASEIRSAVAEHAPDVLLADERLDVSFEEGVQSNPCVGGFEDVVQPLLEAEKIGTCVQFTVDPAAAIAGSGPSLGSRVTFLVKPARTTGGLAAAALEGLPWWPRETQADEALSGACAWFREQVARRWRTAGAVVAVPATAGRDVSAAVGLTLPPHMTPVLVEARRAGPEKLMESVAGLTRHLTGSEDMLPQGWLVETVGARDAAAVDPRVEGLILLLTYEVWQRRGYRPLIRLVAAEEGVAAAADVPHVDFEKARALAADYGLGFVPPPLYYVAGEGSELDRMRTALRDLLVLVAGLPSVAVLSGGRRGLGYHLMLQGGAAAGCDVSEVFAVSSPWGSRDSIMVDLHGLESMSFFGLGWGLLNGLDLLARATSPGYLSAVPVPWVDLKVYKDKEKRQGSPSRDEADQAEILSFGPKPGARPIKEEWAKALLSWAGLRKADQGEQDLLWRSWDLVDRLSQLSLEGTRYSVELPEGLRVPPWPDREVWQIWMLLAPPRETFVVPKRPEELERFLENVLKPDGILSHGDALVNLVRRRLTTVYDALGAAAAWWFLSLVGRLVLSKVQRPVSDLVVALVEKPAELGEALGLWARANLDRRVVNSTQFATWFDQAFGRRRAKMLKELARADPRRNDLPWTAMTTERLRWLKGEEAVPQENGSAQPHDGTQT